MNKQKLTTSIFIFILSLPILVSGQINYGSNNGKYLTIRGIKIYYEDKHIVVIEKPTGLLSVATDFEMEETAHAILKNHCRPKRVFIVHRLDQDASGVMLFALSEEARDALKLVFEAHDIQRNYAAVVEGSFDLSNGKWESYVYEDANYVVHSSQDPTRGKLAVTHYKVKHASRKYTWLDLTLETGRKNQIRVHCKDAGHPIVGDKKYGAVSNPVKRLCLHAHVLAFDHPVTHQKMHFESPVPESFKQLFGAI